MSGYSTKGAAPTNGSVYVSNLPLGTDENMLAEYFGTIGLLKVWYYPGTLIICFCFFSTVTAIFHPQHVRASLLFGFIEGQTNWYSQGVAVPRQRD